MPDALTLTMEEAQEMEQLRAEHERMRRALERIRGRAADDLADLPDTRTVSHTLVSGMLLALQGLAESGLE